MGLAGSASIVGGAQTGLTGLDMTAAGTFAFWHRGINQTNGENGTIVEQLTDATAHDGTRVRFINTSFWQLDLCTGAGPVGHVYPNAKTAAKYCLSNQWYHLAVTFDGTTVLWYVNGKFSNTQAQTATPTTAGVRNTAVLEGMTAGVHAVSDVRLWTRAVKGSEMARVFQGRLLGDEGAAWYRGNSNGRDYGANGNHLTAVALSATRTYCEDPFTIDPPSAGKLFGLQYRTYLHRPVTPAVLRPWSPVTMEGGMSQLVGDLG